MNGERMRLTCPLTQGRLQQACRVAGCTHAQAICATARPAIMVTGTRSEELLRCPLCQQQSSAPLVVDIPLTLFLSEHPWADSCRVRKASDGSWFYDRPRSGKSSSRQGKNRSDIGIGIGSSSSSSAAAAQSACCHSSSGRNSSSSDGNGSSSSRSQPRGTLGAQSAASSHPCTLATDSRPPLAGGKRHGVGDHGQHVDAFDAAAAKRNARAARRERIARTRLLDAMRTEIIRRELHE